MAERRQSRKQSRKQSRRQSKRRASSKRKSSTRRQSARRGSRRGSRGGRGGRGGKDGKHIPQAWRDLREYFRNNKTKYFDYFHQLQQKKLQLAKDCRYGRKLFLDWLAGVFRTLGLHATQQKMPVTQDLTHYGPEGPPNVILAWSARPNPKKWTLCVFGNYDPAEPRLKDPCLLLDGRFFPKRYRPEDWQVLAAWLSAIHTFSNVFSQWPINLKLVWTANQADDAPSLVKFINAEKNEFFDDVDFFCTSTTLSSCKLPGGIVYGGRGACHFILDITNGLDEAVECSSGSEYFRQVATDMVKMLDDLEKDCIYSYLHLYDAFKLPSNFRKLGTKAYVRDHDPEVEYWFRPSVLRAKEKYFEEMWKPEVRLEEITHFPRDEVTKTPSRLAARFCVKYMSETAPIRIEEMVNRLLRKKWDTLDSKLDCRLTMDYWARPWLAEGDNQLYNRAKRAVARSFHQVAIGAIDFNPNPLPAILEILIQKEVVVLSLAATLEMNKPSLKRNYLTNIKMLICFISLLQKCGTTLEYRKKFTRIKTDTTEIRRNIANLVYIRSEYHPPPEEKPEEKQEKSEGKKA